MRVGLIGHRGSGKTTIFNVLTGQQAQVGEFSASFRGEIHLGVIKVPDARFSRLAEIFGPKKTTPAEIMFTDFPAESGGEKQKAPPSVLGQVREVDAVALVLGDFAPEANPVRE